MMLGTPEAVSTVGASSGTSGSNLTLISTQLSWMRSDLSNVRTLLSCARNLGLALVAVGTLAMTITIWNVRSISKALAAMDAAFLVPQGSKQRWLYSYTRAAVLPLIGLMTLLFMLRVI